MISTDKSILQKIDIFGVVAGLQYQESTKFTSKLGGFFTLALIGILSALFSQQIIQISSKDTPTIVLDQYVEPTTKYEINSDNFNFMIALLQNGNQPIVDPKVFDISAVIIEQYQQIQNDNTIKFSEKQTKLSLVQCSLVELSKMINQPLLISTNYQHFFCISNQNSIQLQSSDSSNTYIKFFVKECTVTSTCLIESDRQNIINNASVQVFFSNPTLQLSNQDEPFQKQIKSKKYNLMSDYSTNIEQNFTKTQVIDDSGLFIKNQVIKEDITNSSTNKYLGNKENDVIFSMKIQLDSDSQSRYRRNYMRIPEIFAFIGGLFNVLFFLGGLISKPYNNHLFERSFLNDISTIQQNKQRLKRAYSNECNIPISKRVVSNNQDKVSISKYQNSLSAKFKNNLRLDIEMSKQDEQKEEKNVILQLKDDIKQLTLTFFSCFYCFCLDVKEKMDKDKQKVKEYLNLVSYASIFSQFESMNEKIQDSILKSRQEIQNDIKQLMTPSIATHNEKQDDSFIDNKQPKIHFDFTQKSEACVTFKEEAKLLDNQEEYKIPLKDQLTQYKQSRQRAKSASKINSNQMHSRPFFQKFNLQKVQLEVRPDKIVTNDQKHVHEPVSIMRKRQHSIQSPLPFEYLKNSFEFKVVSPLKIKKSSNLKDSSKIDAPSESSSPHHIYQSMNPKLFSKFYEDQVQTPTKNNDAQSPTLSNLNGKSNSIR